MELDFIDSGLFILTKPSQAAIEKFKVGQKR